MGMSVGQNTSIVPEIFEENEKQVANQLPGSIAEISPAEVSAAWQSMAVSTDGAEIASRNLEGPFAGVYAGEQSPAEAMAEIVDSLGIPLYGKALIAAEDAGDFVGENPVRLGDAVKATRALDRQIAEIVVNGVSNMASEAAEAVSDFVKAPLAGDDS